MLLCAVALLLAARMLGRHQYGWQFAVATGVALGLGAAGARLLALDVRRRGARVRSRARVEAAARHRRRDCGGDGALVRPAGDRVRQSGLRPAHAAARRSGIGVRLGSTSASGCRTSSPIRSGRTSATKRSRRRTARSGATTSASGEGAASARAFSACCRRCSRSWAGRFCSHARGECRRACRRLCCRASGSWATSISRSAIRRRTGTCLKASYMLTTAPAWALAFGYAVDRLPGRTRVVVASILAASALASLPFLLY